MDNQTALEKLKEAYERFWVEVDSLRKEHREEIDRILKEINEEKLKNIREKLKNV